MSNTGTRRKRPKRPRMTAAEARTFEGGLSLRSAAEVAEQLDCSCEPYADVFTYGRWQAQGFQVRKGEKAIRFSTWIRPGSGEASDDEDDAQGDEQPRLLKRRVFVFCRCQVDEKS